MKVIQVFLLSSGGLGFALQDDFLSLVFVTCIFVLEKGCWADAVPTELKVIL